MNVFQDLRVVDVSVGVAGPIVGMFLGDHGADVVKVERPEGDWARAMPGFQVWNRNKRGAVVDPSSAEDVAWLATSVERADVLILGTRELSELGQDVQEAAARNRRLVIVRLPAYLDGWTPWTGDTESNGLLCAIAGLARRQSSFDGGPVEAVSPFVLHAHGLWATTCTVAALVERLDSDLGQTVTVTGMQGMMEFNLLSLSTHPGAPDADTRVGPTGRHTTYRHFVTIDGRWIACGALGPKFETALLNALGLSWILEDERIGGETMKLLMPDNLVWATEAIEHAFASRTVEELMELMSAIGIPCGPVGDRDDWLDNEQIRAIGMRAEVKDEAGRTIVMPGVPFRLTKTPGSVRTAAPALAAGALPELWADRNLPEPTSVPRHTPGPLHGYSVLDMGTYVATPYAGFLLAELGADVIKVEPLTGDPFRGSAYTVNRGMRSLAINLQTEEGRDTFHRIARVSDAVIDGMRPGVMAKLGLDYDTLSQINPEIVSLSLSAYGEGGPDSMRPGVDMVIQAQSGMMDAQGGDDIPVANTIAVNDTTTAAMTALGFVLALYSRKVTGEGQRVWDSLAATSAFLQDNELVRFEGRPPGARGGRDYLGTEPLHRYYAVSDGWVYVDAEMHDDRTEADVVRELRGAAGDGMRLGEVLASMTPADAVSALSAAGVRAAEARTVSQVLHDPEMLDHEVFHIRIEDETGEPFMMTGRHEGFSRSQRRGPLSPPGIGEHTGAVLAGSGFTDDEIEQLLADSIVVEGGAITHRLPTAYR